jgi:hypothetical protein
VTQVREARARYFADNGFSEASYSDRWVKLKLGPIPIYFPNSPSRKRAIPLHDLHHVATDYKTSWTGEAEIAAWEIGGSCTTYWAAWMLNLGGFAYGLAIAPRRVYRAFIRGRHSKNLYHSGWSDDLLGLSVDELRTRLGITDRPVATARDRLAFCGAVAAAWWPVLAAGVFLGVRYA